MPILEDGQLFERYRVHRWLGSGVAGESYEAEDRILQRKVTLKLIHPWGTLTDSARRQFFREMQGISLLNHPYLATVLDYGETDGYMYLARRYVSSGSLLSTNGRLWFHPPLSARDAFTYTHQLAQALQYIHQHGYLHGALTFANVLVLRGPNTEMDPNYAPFLIADIGLAHFVRRFGRPRIETLPVSAAPEQSSKRLTPASDQFALAVLIYFWLAGRPPYLGNPHEIEQQKFAETITPLSILNPGISLEQDAIIQRALAAYPEDRYSSVLAFTEELLASLNAPGRHYAQPETPRPDLQTVQDRREASAEEARTPETIAQSIPQAGHAIPEETSATTTSAQPAEHYRSALEELLALPPSTKASEPTEQPDLTHTDEPVLETFADQQDELLPFPALPDTPPVEGLSEKEDLALNAFEESAYTQDRKQTEPLAVEPSSDILQAQVDEATLEMPLELSESTSEPASDLLPPAPQEPPMDFWEKRAFAESEEEIPTVPHEEFIRAARAQEHMVSSDNVESGTLSEDSLSLANETRSEDTNEQPDPVERETPAEHNTFEMTSADSTSNTTQQQEPVSASSDWSLFAETEAGQANLQKEFEIDDEGFVVLSPDEFATFRDVVSPVVFPDEPLPLDAHAMLPLEETTPEHSEEIVRPPSTSPSLNTNEENPSEEEKQSESLHEILPKPETENEEQAQTPDLSLNTAVASPEQPSALTEEIATQQTEQALDTHTFAESAPAVPTEQSGETTEPEIYSDASDETEFIDEENIPTVPRASYQFPAEDISLPSEIIQDQPGENIQTPSTDEDPTPPRISAPLQETPETSKTTYPPIDEAVVVPRLLISSPYTSSSYEFLLISDETNIGRAGSSDVYLEQDNLTSRHHALLKRAGERILIFDKHSHNGVYLNGQKIEVGRGYELADGDHIGIGNYELIFRSAPAGHVPQLI